MLQNLSQATKLSEEYNIPLVDVLLITLNICGIKSDDIRDSRIRFKLKLDFCKEVFYLAICVNTRTTPFSMIGNNLFFKREKIGVIIEREKDTCDSTYFRRDKTVLTLNSNSRSRCKGCKFCGTYNQDAEDSHNLLFETDLIDHMRKVLKENNMENYNRLRSLSICTGCFGSRDMALNHILMVRCVLKKEFGFEKTLHYIGSEIYSKKHIDTIAENALPFSLSLTTEVFTRRTEMMKKIKSRITLNKAKDILVYSAKKGLSKVNILYILGLDPLDVIIKKFRDFASLMNRFPIINLFQDYNAEQEALRDPEAANLHYYLRARKELETIFKNTGLRPEPWENYRGLWYLKFGDEKINNIRI